MRKISMISVLLLCIFLITAGCGHNTEDAATNDKSSRNNSETIKVISFIPENNEVVKDIIPMWIEKIESESDLKVEFIGGPESIPAEEQFGALQNGLVDVSFIASSFYGHIMPEANSLYLSPFTPEEERNNGYFDYLNERFNVHGIEYLGRFIGNSPFYFWSNSKIESLDDLKGKKFRSNATYHEILNEIGVTPVDIVPGEVYTALERNMVDGFGFPLIGPHEDGWTEVTKYLIDEPFLNQNATILMCKSTFDSLSKINQEKLKQLTAEFEYEMLNYFAAKNEEARENIKKDGVEIIKLSDEDSERFQRIVNDVWWEKLMTEAPNEVEKIKRLFIID